MRPCARDLNHLSFSVGRFPFSGPQVSYILILFSLYEPCGTEPHGARSSWGAAISIDYCFTRALRRAYTLSTHVQGLSRDRDNTQCTPHRAPWTVHTHTTRRQRRRRTRDRRDVPARGRSQHSVATRTQCGCVAVGPRKIEACLLSPLSVSPSPVHVHTIPPRAH